MYNVAKTEVKERLLDDDNITIIGNPEMDKALAAVIAAAIQVASDMNLEENERKRLLDMVQEAYYHRKAKSFMQARLGQFNSAFDYLKTLVRDPEKSEKYTNAYYYNRVQHYKKDEILFHE